MAVTDTTTIRVAKTTRDKLAQEARERGMSVSELVGQMAGEAERERIFAAEREATRLDALNPEAVAEYELWDEAASDGID
jgi:macrodomain Ter protein organizer (MatP/YcbG family)